MNMSLYDNCPVCGLEVLKGSKACPACRTVLLVESKFFKQEPLDYQKHQVASDNPKKESYSFSPPIDEANLYSCSACGHAVSWKAQECPSCGEPNQNAPASDTNKQIGSLIFVISMIALWFMWKLNNP